LAIALGGVAILARAALEEVEPLVLLGPQLLPLGRGPARDRIHEHAERVQAALDTDRLGDRRERAAFRAQRDDAVTDLALFARGCRRRGRAGARGQTGRTLAAFGPFWPASIENSTF